MMFSELIRLNEVVVSVRLSMVIIRFGWFWLVMCVVSVVCIMLVNECGFFGGSGISM